MKTGFEDVAGIEGEGFNGFKCLKDSKDVDGSKVFEGVKAFEACHPYQHAMMMKTSAKTRLTHTIHAPGFGSTESPAAANG